MSRAESITRVRTRAVFWFSVVVFARLYTAVLNDFLGSIVGWEFIGHTWINGIPTYLWVEIIFYGPVIWLALYNVNVDVFGDVPTEPEALKKHRRLQFIGTAAIAIIIYGIGIHVTDAIEVLSREREGITDGAVYDLVYFFDEGLSHYVQFFPLFFVMGWFLIFDRPGRTGSAYFALFLGAAHGVERAVGIIEGEKMVPRTSRDGVDGDRGVDPLAPRRSGGVRRVLLPPRHRLLAHPARLPDRILSLVRRVPFAVIAERRRARADGDRRRRTDRSRHGGGHRPRSLVA